MHRRALARRKARQSWKKRSSKWRPKLSKPVIRATNHAKSRWKKRLKPLIRAKGENRSASCCPTSLRKLCRTGSRPVTKSRTWEGSKKPKVIFKKYSEILYLYSRILNFCSFLILVHSNRLKFYFSQNFSTPELYTSLVHFHKSVWARSVLNATVLVCLIENIACNRNRQWNSSRGKGSTT